MNELTPQHIDIVTRYVKRHNIVFSHLCDDIIDHLCCDLEESVREGVEFNEAFRQLKQKIGKGGITKIQQDTLYAVDSKYRTMKNLSKVTGVAGTVLLGFSTVFKLQHYPSAGILLVVGAIILVTLFLPSSLMVLWKESKSKKNIFMFVTAFFASALFIAGILFKVQHWPGSSVMLVLGVMIALLILLPASMVSALKNQEHNLPSWVIISGAASLFLYGAGFLVKVMHWPGASVLLTISIISLVSIIIPAYFYHRWKDDEHVSLEALFLIFIAMIFIVTTSIINLNNERNFNNFFIETSSLNERNIELRMLRNDDLISTTVLSEHPELKDIESTKEKVMSSINRLENSLIPSYQKIKEQLFTDGLTDQDDLFDYHRTAAILIPESEMIAELMTNLAEYTSMVESILSKFQEQYQPELLSLNTYIPLITEADEDRNYRSPIVLVQSLEVLKGAVLDAEALTIRNLQLKSDK